MCGVATTCGSWASRHSFGGSTSNTSSAAPATCPDSIASASAASSISSPRAVLTIRMPRLHLASRVRVEEMPRFGRRRKVEADVVGDVAHAVEAEQLDAERGRDVLGNERVVRDDFHAEGAAREPRLPVRFVRARRVRASCREARRRSASSCPRRRASSWRRRSGPTRASDSISASACSATLTLLPPGAFITRMPRALAAARSTLSMPVPARAITRSFGAAASSRSSTLVALRTTSASALARSGASTSA